MKQFLLNKQIALITGGGSGIGFGIAKSMLEAGATVVVVGRNVEKLQQAAAELGTGADYIAHDVTALDENPDLIAEVVRRYGRLDILVNNAGVHLKKWAVDTSDDEFQNLMQVHVNAAFSLSRHAIPELRKTKGSLLFTASMTSFIGMTQVIAYSVAKSGYLGFVRALSAELAEEGVRVNAIAPGWIQSPMLEQALSADPDRKAKILGRTPMNKFGDPEDIGNAAVYLASPAAKFITGVVLPVDGGAVCGF